MAVGAVVDHPVRRRGRDSAGNEGRGGQRPRRKPGHHGVFQPNRVVGHHVVQHDIAVGRAQGGVEDEDIRPCAADQNVVPCAPHQSVVPSLAAQRVVAAPSVHRVVPGQPAQRVGIVVATKDVVEKRPLQVLDADIDVARGMPGIRR